MKCHVAETKSISRMDSFFLTATQVQSLFPDYLEVATAVIVPRGVGKTSPVHRYSVDIFFHILARREYRVLTESRIPLKPVLGGVRIVAPSISSQEQTQ